MFCPRFHIKSPQSRSRFVILYPYFSEMSKLSTYGPKPRVYVLEGERYYVGADVGNYLKCHRGKLYKHYPNMWRRVATPEEKRLIHEMNNGAHALSSNVMLVRCDEVDEIFAGNDEKFRAVKGGGQSGNAGLTPQIRKDLGTPGLGNRALRGLSTPAWMNSSVSFPQYYSRTTLAKIETSYLCEIDF